MPVLSIFPALLRLDTPHIINTGSEVYSNELVKTGDKGIARLVFLDRTDLVVGPRSEVKLDKFVYDPEGDSGAFATNVARGAFRFVTGTQDHRNYSINTPHGTLGVRGTTFELVVTSDRTDVHLVNGAVEVKSSTNQTVVLTVRLVLPQCSDRPDLLSPRHPARTTSRI